MKPGRAQSIATARGFTLLELLVALLVFSVMSVMAYGGLRTVLDTRTLTTRAAQRLTDLQKTFLFVQRDLAQAVERGVRDPLGAPLPAFEGGDGHRRLLALTTAGIEDAGAGLHDDLLRIEYRIDAGVLWRDRWPVLDPTQQIRPDATPLLTGVTAVTIRFLDSEWRRTWPPPGMSGGILPRAVALTIRLADGGVFERLFALPDA